MKAKDAKAKKKNGNVVKITKESDTDWDGGVGPLPAANDILAGMLDSDLDADPEAEVRVTEVVDTVTDESSIIGMEGVDYIVEYDDPHIVEMEASFGENIKLFGQKILEMLKKIGAFIQSIWKKFVGLFQNMDQLIKGNEAAINSGLKDSKKMITTKFVFNGNGAALVNQGRSIVETIFNDISANMAKTETGNFEEDMERGANIIELAKVCENIFKEVPAGKIEITKCGISSTADLNAIAGKDQQKKFDDIIKKVQKVISAGEKAAKKAINRKDELAKAAFGAIKTGCATMQKAIGIIYKTNGKAVSFAFKVARCAMGGSVQKDAA
jgi:hypothetical protein